MVDIVQILTFLLVLSGCIAILWNFRQYTGKNRVIQSNIDTVEKNFEQHFENITVTMNHLVSNFQSKFETITGITQALGSGIESKFVSFQEELIKLFTPEEEEDQTEVFETIIHNSLVKFMQQDDLKAYVTALFQDTINSNPVVSAMGSEEIDPEKVKGVSAGMMITALQDQNPIVMELAARYLGEDWETQIAQSPATFAAIIKQVQGFLPGNLGNMFNLSNNGNRSHAINKPTTRNW